MNRIVGWLSAIEMEDHRPGPSSSQAVGHYRLPHVWAILGPCSFSYKPLCTHKYMGFMFKYQLIEFTFISVSNPNCTPKYALCRCGCNWRVNAILPNPPCVREIFGSWRNVWPWQKDWLSDSWWDSTVNLGYKPAFNEEPPFFRYPLVYFFA